MPNRTTATGRPLTPSEDNARRVLNQLMGMMGLKDAEVAERLGVARSAAQARRSGITPIDLRDADRLAEALDVPPLVFNLPYHEAARWIVDNRPDLLIGAKPWSGDTRTLAKAS